jgi:hypothetical protein
VDAARRVPQKAESLLAEAQRAAKEAAATADPAEGAAKRRLARELGHRAPDLSKTVTTLLKR